MPEQKIKKPKYAIWIPVMSLMALLTGAVLVVNSLYGTTMKVAFTQAMVSPELMAQAEKDAADMNVQLEEEGAVLLKNDSKTLPISTSSGKVKINLFGVKSVDLTYNAAGSAAGTTTDAVTLKAGLEKGGFSINEDLYSLVSSNATASSTDVNEGGSSKAVNEMSLDKYTGNCAFDKLKAYSEYAVVTIGRLGGEGGDISRTGFGSSKTDHYLKLNDNEKALLKELKSDGFKTIVLINSSYAMELGFLEEADYGVSAALWIGGPGAAGTPAIGYLLNGTVTPSGRLADTYAYDLTTGSAFYTSDKYNYVVDKGSANYEDEGGWSNYNEGIYVGYKWYETADYAGYWASKGGYGKVVQYPFGYGSSYASFTQAFESAPTFADNTFTFKVKVTNTSADYAGKDVVQIYCEVPYIEGGVEKSKVSLVSFDKTSLLAKGGSASETLTLTTKLEDLASYDESANSGKGSYILDPGDYHFYLSDNAHSWSSIASEKTYTYALANKITYSGSNKRSSDKSEAANKLIKDDTQQQTLSLSNGISVLSRKGNFANASVLKPAYTSITLNGASAKATIITTDSAEYKALVTNAKAYGTYQGSFKDATLNASKKYTFKDMYGVAYDDPKWQEFVSELSKADMAKLIGTGGWSTAEIDSINKPGTIDIDGPFGLSNYIKTEKGDNGDHCMSYCSEVVTASTFNPELMNEYGKIVGEEANASGTAGWYAPGANLHRSPFSGRNAEYYSEDSYLSGIACAQVVSGAQSKGLYVYCKHFAFNDQEANRTNKENCFMNEQTARETYLRPFELAVKDGGAQGLMAAYMWINGNWLGSNNALINGIARNEWGMQGMVITDNFCGSWMSAAKGILGGTDLMLSSGTKEVDSVLANKNEGICAMKEACYHILYGMASVQNNREVPLQSGTNTWPAIEYSCLAAFGVIFFSAGGLLTYEIVRAKKAKKAQENSTPTAAQ
jgi:beta-glucosidase